MAKYRVLRMPVCKCRYICIVRYIAEFHGPCFFFGPNGIRFARCHFRAQKCLNFQSPSLPVALVMDVALINQYVPRHINNRYIIVNMALKRMRIRDSNFSNAILIKFIVRPDLIVVSTYRPFFYNVRRMNLVLCPC